MYRRCMLLPNYDRPRALLQSMLGAVQYRRGEPGVITIEWMPKRAHFVISSDNGITYRASMTSEKVIPLTSSASSNPTRVSSARARETLTKNSISAIMLIGFVLRLLKILF